MKDKNSKDILYYNSIMIQLVVAGYILERMVGSTVGGEVDCSLCLGRRNSC